MLEICAVIFKGAIHRGGGGGGGGKHLQEKI